MLRSYALGEHFERLIDELVKGGRYNNASEVVREGLRLLEDRETLRRLKVEEIRRSKEESRRSGVTLPKKRSSARWTPSARLWPNGRGSERPSAPRARGPRRPPANRGFHRPAQPGTRPDLRAEVREHCRRIAAQPRFHRLREEFGPGVRVAVHGAYLVLHTLRDDDRVVIERVVHGARDLGSLLDG